MKEEEKPLTQEELANLTLWYTSPQAMERLGTTAKYLHTLGTQYHKFRTQKIGYHQMLYFKADVDAYKVVQGQPGPRRKIEGPDPVVKRPPGRPRKSSQGSTPAPQDTKNDEEAA